MSKSVLHYPGGKKRIASWIIKHMPPHHSYLEPYFGCGADYSADLRENERKGRMKIKACKRCGVNPVLEMWSSGRLKCAVRCNNPDRGEGCDWKFYHSLSNNKEDAVRKWNEVN